MENKSMTMILDCTLRDGGYYTNWDFSDDFIHKYCKYVSDLPIKYVEIGYRSPIKEGYHGRYFYLPTETLLKLKSLLPGKKLSIMLNLKDINSRNIPSLLHDCKDSVELIRIATNPDDIETAIKLGKEIKQLGLKVGINLMYLSKMQESDLKRISTIINENEDCIDYLFLVDSFGGVTPNSLQNLVRYFKREIDYPIGFHGHNNMELAFANAMVAIEEGAEFIDATVLGMGRGAGNLKTELMLIHLENKGDFHLNYNRLSQLTSLFYPLWKEYEWGTSFPYMISGAKSLPQQDIMSWLGKKRYSVENIVIALQNITKKHDESDNLHKFCKSKIDLVSKRALVIGGGCSIERHKEAIKSFLLQNKDVVLIYSSTRYLSLFNRLDNKKILCLMGNEGTRLDDLFKEKILGAIDLFVFPAQPQKMGLYVPEYIKGNSCYIDNLLSIPKDISDSPLSLVLNVSVDLELKELLIGGFDGYKDIDNDKGSNGNLILHQETQDVINYLNDSASQNITISSVTPSEYRGIKSSSIYALIK